MTKYVINQFHFHGIYYAGDYNDIHYHIDHVDTINYNDNSQTLKIE